jgi:DNA processing protein
MTACRRCHSIISQSRDQGIDVISVFDERYPPLLRRIPDPPPVIYLKGQLPEGNRNVACVGTRHPSAFGEEVAKRLTTMLVQHNFWIISGLALGIDTASHMAALDASGKTVAILANGLDSVYPAKNKELANEIVDRGGGLISEQPPGARAFAKNLVDRDRLQSGMSLATFVMQTDIVGGTMHTVRFTLEQQRLLFVPKLPERHAADEPSRGIKALAEMTGSELANILKTDTAYRQLLLTKFATKPPARPIASQAEYASVIRELHEAEIALNGPESQKTLF